MDMGLDDLKEGISKMADSDSPEHVKIDGTWSSLLVWAIARFGVGIIGFAFGYKVYMDMRADYSFEREEKKKMIVVLERMIDQQKELKSSLEGQRQSFDTLVKTLERK
jgi:hypothetical protein